MQRSNLNSGIVLAFLAPCNALATSQSDANQDLVMASENPRLTSVSSDFRSMIMSNDGNFARCSAAGAFVRSRKLRSQESYL